MDLPGWLDSSKAILAPGYRDGPRGVGGPCNRHAYLMTLFALPKPSLRPGSCVPPSLAVHLRQISSLLLLHEGDMWYLPGVVVLR